jgi:hypothetical protein
VARCYDTSIDRMELGDITRLLDEFSRLPQLTRVEPTILEIAGYPHYENVASNILAFFLDPKKGHGLGRIVLESLLAAAGWPNNAESDLTGQSSPIFEGG